jgi:bifunctional non-homologous end joining protein LigD
MQVDEPLDFAAFLAGLAHPDKLLYPADGITKRQVVEYYWRIGPHMLPHLLGRPVNLQRFPNGIESPGFIQQGAPAHFPSWIHRAPVTKKSDGVVAHILCHNRSTLAYLAAEDTIAIHAWLSTIDHLDRPDRLVFDLDPPGEDFEPVRQAAFVLRRFLSEELGLEAAAMSTGSRGVHVVVPIEPAQSFDEVRAFARMVAEVLASRHPEALTTRLRKEERQGRLFLDYLRNSYAQTSVVPYSLRAKQGAPVATPLTWEELASPGINARSYGLQNIWPLLSQRPDPLLSISLQPLSAALERLSALVRGLRREGSAQ